MDQNTDTHQIIVVPFHGQGHVFPCVELCKRIAARGVAVTILADHSISASLQKTAREARDHLGLNISVIELADKEEETPPATEDEEKPPPATEEEEKTPPEFQNPESFMDGEAERMEEILRSLSARPACVIGDVMVPWAAAACKRLDIPMASFFTSGACALASEHAIWKYRDQIEKEKKPFSVPGFPPSMTLDPSDTHNRPPPPGGPPGARPGAPPGAPPGGHNRRHPGGGPPRKGPRPPRGRPQPPPPGGGGFNPPWMNEMKNSVAALVNTSRVLEAPFVDYVATEIDKPSWAVGPLLPTSFWEEGYAGAATHDSTVRSGVHQSNVDEDRCLAWLDKRAPRSVVYVSFGSEVGPSEEEFKELALGLEEAEKAFILVLKDEYEDCLPVGYEARVEGRGLVIRGWAPQLMILSHEATGGFLSHCGWNSTVESLGHGVPLLAWPIRGDQHYNAKLLVKELRVAAMVEGAVAERGVVRRESVAEGVKVLMESEEGDGMRKKAEEIRGLLRSSRDSSQKEVDAFLEHILNLPKDEAQTI